MARYGREADGTVSPCRAKPGNEGKYGCHHTQHVDISPREADALNEAVNALHAKQSQLGAMNKSSVSSGGDDAGYVDDGARVKSMLDGLDRALNDSDAVYRKSVEAMQSVESMDRSDMREEFEYAPSGDTTSDASYRSDLEWVNGMRSKGMTPGRTLFKDEEKALMDTLDRSIGAAPDSTKVSPAQEYALRMLVLNPAQSENTLSRLSKNDWVARNAARYVISAPNVTDTIQRNMWKKYPSSALESQNLKSRFVDSSLSKYLNKPSRKNGDE